MKRDKIVLIILFCLIVIQAVVIFWLAILLQPKKPVVVKPPPITLKGKIAIVIDDWGYHDDTLAIVSQIKYPITAAVLPNLTYSTAVAAKLHEMNIEVIMHLPMEPREKIRLEKNTILVNMTARQIGRIINNGLDNLVYCKGVSNHMGSQLTTDRRAMEIILRELKQRGLYFLDSVVAPTIVSSKLARELGVKFAKRDVFLDNKGDPAYIREQINILKHKARFYGQAIGIGHDRKTTLKVLSEVIPELAKEGYKFVFVSNLVK